MGRALGRLKGVDFYRKIPTYDPSPFMQSLSCMPNLTVGRMHLQGPDRGQFVGGWSFYHCSDCDGTPLGSRK